MSAMKPNYKNILNSCNYKGIYCIFNLVYGVSVHVNLTASLSATQYGFSLSQVWVDDNRDGFLESNSVHQRALEVDKSWTSWEMQA